VRSALRFVDGVECAHADLETRTATVECVESCDREALLAALRTKGIEGVLREPDVTAAP
jgi:hypothetical protein